VSQKGTAKRVFVEIKVGRRGRGGIYFHGRKWR
jgi:hypothetical protein